MTKVRYYSAPTALPGGGAGRAYRLVVAGHAGYGEKGRDIVCAAESMLVQALAGTLAGLSPALLYDYTVGVWPAVAAWASRRCPPRRAPSGCAVSGLCEHPGHRGRRGGKRPCAGSGIK